MTVAGTDKATLEPAIIDHVEPGSTIHTDEWASYHGLGQLGYAHERVNHGAGEYVRDGVTSKVYNSQKFMMAAA